MVRTTALSLAALLLGAALVAGCGYAKTVTRRSQRSAPNWSPERQEYGGVAVEFVQEYRRAEGWRAFPDGGVPLMLTYKAVFHQVDEAGRTDRIIGEANLKAVRGTDRGNLEDLSFEWIAADQFEFRIVNGYSYGGGPTAETKGRFQVQPLH